MFLGTHTPRLDDKGRLTLPALLTAAPDLLAREVFTCGPPPFMSAVREHLDLLAADPEAKFVVAGDVNDFEFSQTADILADVVEGSGSTAMTDLPRTLPQSDRWTYVYEGNSQGLDHIFVSPSLATLDGTVGGPWRGAQGKGQGQRPAFSYDIVRTNSPFADQDSDHDPQVVRLDLKK